MATSLRRTNTTPCSTSFETDEHDTMLNENASELKTVFKDGVMLNKTTFAEIRARVNGGE